MESNEQVLGSKRFGAYLKTVRESRKLSLDSVEEMTSGYPERVTKSHLSRIENGLAIPTFPRLLALGQIYGVPIGSLAERFEIELRREKAPVDISGMEDLAVIEDANRMRSTGRFADALMLLLALGDRVDDLSSPFASTIRVHVTTCLAQLGRYQSAKEHAESILAAKHARREDRLVAMLLLATCCYRLGRHTIAMMALDQADAEMSRGGCPPELKNFAGDLLALRGNVAAALGDPASAIVGLERAVAHYAAAGDMIEKCRARVALAAAYYADSRVDAAKQLLEEVLRETETRGYDRLTALALHHLGRIACREGHGAVGIGYFVRSNSIARITDHISLVFCNCFYLWRLAKDTGDRQGAVANLRSLRSLVGRVEDVLPEVEEFRSTLARGES